MQKEIIYKKAANTHNKNTQSERRTCVDEIKENM